MLHWTLIKRPAVHTSVLHANTYTHEHKGIANKLIVQHSLIGAQNIQSDIASKHCSLTNDAVLSINN